MKRTVTTEDERRLLGVIRRVVAMTDNGAEPDEAIAKVAQEERLTPGAIRVVCNAYNTGRQLAQREWGGSVLDKLAAFPLANAENVLARLYGTTDKPEKAAVAADYQFDPYWLEPPRPPTVKAAGTPPPPKAPLTLTGRLRCEKTAWSLARQEAERWQLKQAEAEAGLYEALDRLERYFRRPALDRESFGVFAKAASAYAGPTGKLLVQLLLDRAPRSLRRSWQDELTKTAVQKQPWDERTPPWSWAVAALRQTGRLLRARTERAAWQEKHAQLRREGQRWLADQVWESLDRSEPVRSILPPHPAEQLLAEAEAVKRADSAEEASLTERGVGRVLGPHFVEDVRRMVLKHRPQMVQSVVDELNDAAHMRDLERIRVQAMLAEILSDPEHPASSANPDAVLDEYNRLAAIAPRSASSSATVAPLLRRRLSGVTEPFEAKELADMERSLAVANDEHLRPLGKVMT